MKEVMLSVLSKSGKKLADITLSKSLSYDQIQIVRVCGYRRDGRRWTKFLARSGYKKDLKEV
jgi:hypothetical protein